MPGRDPVRLLLWSAGCLPGVHLPFFAAAADGLFADHGLDVELLDSAPGSERVNMLARGDGDFVLTANLYHLQALAEEGPLPVRAVAVLHRRSPVAALVRAGSDIAIPADLAGRRLGAPIGTAMGWLAVELQASLRAGGIGPVTVVDMPYGLRGLNAAQDEIDLIANFADLVPIDERHAGTALRAIPVGPDVYTSSVLAADAVPDDVVERFVAATQASFRCQLGEPGRGVEELCARYPRVDPAVAVETWHALVPYVFDEPGGAMGEMDEREWGRAHRWIAQTHGVPAPSSLLTT